MDYRKARIIFMGTPEFAVASLNKLIEAGCTVIAVVTSPDKPAGRGMQLRQSPVKIYAMANGIKILQPPNLKAEAFLEEMIALHCDLQVVVAFRMLPKAVWSMAPMGTINLHGSLLPQYRGAAPINWAIINGEKITGATTFKLQHEIDTGNILMQETIAIEENETAGELHDKMKDVGANLLLKTVVGLCNGSLEEKPQTSGYNGLLKHAPKISTDTCKIDWNNPVDKIHNLIRGLSPSPGAFSHIQNKMLKIFKSEKSEMVTGISPGDWQTDQKTYLRFACSNGFIYVKELQLEGKKRIQVEEFLKGFRI